MHRSDSRQTRSVWPASVVQLRILQLTQLCSGFYDGSRIAPRSRGVLVGNGSSMSRTSELTFCLAALPALSGPEAGSTSFLPRR